MTLSATGCGTGPSKGETADANTAGDYDSSAPLFNQLPEEFRSTPIVVAMDPTFAGLNSYKEGTQVFQGVNVDLAKALAKPLGTKIELVAAPFEQIIIGVSSGRFDASMSGVTDTAEREKSVDFVDYFRTQQVYFVPKGNPKKVTGEKTSACGMKMSVVSGTPDQVLFDKVVGFCKEAGEPAPKAVSIDSIAASHLALESGRVDVVIRENSSAPSWKDDADTIPIDFGDVTYLGAIVPPADTELRDALLAAFEAIVEDGTYDDILAGTGYEPITLHEPGINLATN